MRRRAMRPGLERCEGRGLLASVIGPGSVVFLPTGGAGDISALIYRLPTPVAGGDVVVRNFGPGQVPDLISVPTTNPIQFSVPTTNPIE